MKKALMIVAIIGIVVIAGSSLYYFVFFKASIERKEIRLQEEKFQQEKNKQTQELLEKMAKEAALSDCLNEAYEEYKRRFSACYDSYTEAWNGYCEDRNLPPDCKLPGDIAKPLTEDYEREIDRTEEAYNDGIDECHRLYD